MQIEHLNKETTDGTVRNLDALYQLFPSCFTEAKDVITGKMRRVVDWGKLRELLGEYVENDEPEKYDFTWVGKRAAQREAAAPCRKTLRPCPEESVDWGTTQNLYIEGDNLEVLKLLQNSYMGKVKMIYIDPPYNTGNDFVYHDDFAQSAEEYDENYQNEEGNKYFRNTETSSEGRFHSDWCSMIYARLMASRTVLSEDGVIFISIDDNEYDNLKKISDEVFNPGNYLATMHIQVRYGEKSLNEEKPFKPMIEYILVYAKNIKKFEPNRPTEEYGLEKFVYEIREKSTGEIFNVGGQDVVLFKKGEWEIIKHDVGSIDFLKETWISGSVYTNMSYGQVFQKVVEPRTEIDGLGCLYKVLGRGEDGLGYRYYTGPQKATATRGKMFSGVPVSRVKEINNGTGSVRYKPILCYNDYSADFGNIRHEGGIPFNSGKKPVKMLSELINLQKDKESIVLDFFSGSASTAHAVIQQNAIDGGKRKYIMVQIPEEIEEKNELRKFGFKNICEIGKERIRRAGKKIKEEHPEAKALDIGFRVLKCDESNYKPVAFAPKDYTQESLDMFLDNIKEERTGLDLLFDCMMRWGLELSLPYETQKVDGCTIYDVDEGSLVACFDGVVTSAVIDAIAETHPLRVVFRDSSFTEAAQKMNLFELFKQKCGWTDQEVQNNVRVI